MITDTGSGAIGRLLADQLGAYIAVGVGTSSPVAGNEALDFEVFRAPVRARAYDATTRTVTYAATIPDYLTLSISEVGLLASPSTTDGSGIVTMFSDELETWTGGTSTNTGIRIGETGRRVALGEASTTGASRVAFMDAKGSDRLQVAFIGAGGNVQIRFENTPTDYHSFSFPATSGYNVASTELRTLVKTGVPDLASATDIRVIHSGTGSVVMDAVRVNTVLEDEALLVRQRFAQAYNKVEGMPLDIEIPVVISL